jgi:hypothetical protein
LTTKKKWITDEQKNDVWAKLNETRSWIDEVTAKQKETPLYEDPVFKLIDLEKKVKNVDNIF